MTTSDAGRDVAEPLFGPRRRDGDGLEQARGRQHEVDRLRWIGDVLDRLGEAAGAHGDRDLAGGDRVDGEAAVGSR